ncbi:class I SAM-dependent methyltransferase [Methylobacterium longum]
MEPKYEEPWHDALNSRSYWYHTMKFPDGEVVNGSWTIDDFLQYIGGYDLKGKTVLDVGTASGYLAFNAEKAGATVTGLDAASTHEFRHVPFADSLSYNNIGQYREIWTRENLIPIKNSWWHAWHKYNSQAKCVYAPIPELYEWPEKSFDVVMAGAIVEHLSEPVFAIGAWARLAREAVLIPFTDVIPVDDLMMRPITPLNDSRINYVWWHISRGLYNKIFSNLGFDVYYTTAYAQHNDADSGSEVATRPSIIAIRRGTEAARAFVPPVALVAQAPEPPVPERRRKRGLLARLSPRRVK